MESANVTSSGTDTQQDIIGPKTLWVLAVATRVCIDLVLALCSFITNIINCVVFKRMGLDNTTESFFLLSISDCLIGFICIVGWPVNVVRYLGPVKFLTSMYTLYLQLLIPATVMALASMVLTTIISLVRCFSVAMPIRVREFTARRQRVVFFLLTGVYIVFVGYGVSSTSLEFQTNNNTNVSNLVVRVHKDYLEKNTFSDFYRVIMFLTCFITINTCLMFLIAALRRSVSFRQSLDNPRNSGRTDNDSASPQNAFIGFRLNTKEIQVVKVVILVAAVFTVCNIPTATLSILRLTVPGMSIDGALRRSFDAAMTSVELFTLVNASVNIIIYLKFNTRYYKTFLKVMGRE